MSNKQPWWKKYQVDVPTGITKNWMIDHFTVSEEEAKLESLRAVFSSSSRGRSVPAGEYTGLYRRASNAIVMSDTPDEIKDCLGFIHASTGSVLIHGLGLGVAARACLLQPAVSSVTIVEIEKEVIELVGPWLSKVALSEGKEISILNDDACTWTPPKKSHWDTVWHDIWDDICEDNLPEMHLLHRRFGRRCDWQGSWGRELIESRRRESSYRRNGWW